MLLMLILYRGSVERASKHAPPQRNKEDTSNTQESRGTETHSQRGGAAATAAVTRAGRLVKIPTLMSSPLMPLTQRFVTAVGRLAEFRHIITVTNNSRKPCPILAADEGGN